ncbi:response regulator (plasmid) [Rhizobium sp. WL3]|uniref:hybrid sensor histidine kinase/response regulator n=1 Tax=Rhizobium sp. WL3 TaxID=2603277 RepID=UPI0011C1E325|nr:hybrid sensor histidine kinase/response regulator [Rhizobium sp. WL3]QEE43226.1 response regulator [Rhizobium sp. WL3]
MLRDAGVDARTVPQLDDLISGLGEDVAFALMTEETLRSADLRLLSEWIKAQPSWSDLPFIILTARGGGPERNPAAGRLSELLGNVSFIERPFHPTTFVSVARSSMRGRRRQYEARNRIEEVREGQRRLQIALEAGRLGAWEFNLADNGLTASQTCREIFGRAATDNFTYEDLLHMIHPEDLEAMQAAVRHSIETGSEYAITYRIVRSDGSIRAVETRAQLDRDRAGRPVKLVGVSADITDRMQAEAQQRHHHVMLEERVVERTRELEETHQQMLAEVSQRERAEEQLRQAQKMEMIGQLTGGVAHDFNNLLMAVLGNLELLRKHVNGDAKTARLIDGAYQGAQRGASLTQRLLAFARRQDLQVGPVNLGTLVADMQGLLQQSVGSAIVIDMHIPAHLPPVLADANQIELALLNLVVNARDAMRDGGAIRVELHEAEQASSTGGLACGPYVVLSVIDQGVGMDAETLQKAIEPFFSTKELGKGTGLGLSMVHGLALQLEGELKLASAPGKGTTAQLWIPVSATDVPQPEQAAAAETTTTNAPRRILLVDDDALIAMSSADMLTDLGHEVMEVYSGKEALTLLDGGEAFDLMITDYSMPGMTGGELVKAVRARFPTMPIVMASGYADLPPGTEIDVARLGKPYSQEQLALVLSKLM